RLATASTAGDWAVRQAVQLGVENTTRDGLPSGDASSADHNRAAPSMSRPPTRRLDQLRTTSTVTVTRTATTRRIRARPAMTLGPPKDPALVQLRHQEAEGAKVQARVQGNHHADRDTEHRREQGVDGEQEGGGDQPDRASDHWGDAACLVFLVNGVP